MKRILRLMVFLVLLGINLPIFAQSAAQKRLLVYFKTGVQRNAPPNQNTVTVTSSTINTLLSNYGLSAANVAPSFPDFNEADTVISEVGESSRQMNYARVFSISLSDTSFKSSLISSLQNLSEVLYAESDGDVTTNLVPADGQYSQQWGLHNTFVHGAEIHAEAAWDIYTGNPNSIIAIIDGVSM